MQFIKTLLAIFVISVFVLLGTSLTQAAAFDFDILLTPPNFASIVQGQSVSITVGVVLRDNDPTQVNFSVSGLPLGTTASFSSPGLNVNDITIITSTTTPAGTSPITIIAKRDNIIKTTIFTLTVTAPRIFRGDGTYTVKHDDHIILNNDFVVIASVTKNRDFSDIEVSLTTDQEGFAFLHPEQEKKIFNYTQKWIRDGAVVRLISQNKEDGEAVIFFQSTKRLGNWSIGTILLFGVAIIAFLLELFIAFRSRGSLYRYTLIRSVILGILLSYIVAILTGGGWAFVVAIYISPVIIAETILFSFIAYKVVAKRKQFN